MSTHLHLRPPTLPRRMRSAPANGATAAAAAAAAAAASTTSPPLAAAAAPSRPVPRQSVPSIPRVLEGSSSDSSSSDSDEDDSEHHMLTDAPVAGLTNDAWFAAPTADEIAASAAAAQQQQQQQEAAQLSRVSVALAEFNSTWFNELRPRAQHTQPAPPPLPPRRKRPEGTAGAAGSAAASASTTAQSSSSGSYALAVPGVASSPSPRPTPSPPQSNLSASLVGYEVLYADGSSSAALPPGVTAQYQAAKSKPKYTLYKILVTLGQPSRPSSARQSPNVSPRLAPHLAHDQPDLESLDLGGGSASTRGGGGAATSRTKGRSQSMSATSSWFVYRRYSDFHTLHQSLLALSNLGGMRNIERNWLLFLPPKVRAPTCFATGVIEMRYSIFDSYVRNLCARPLLAELPEVQHFLGVHDEPLPPHIRGTKPDKNNLHRGKQLISAHLIAKMNGNDDPRFGGNGGEATARGVHRHSASSLNHSGGGGSGGSSASFPLYSIPASSVLDFLSTGDLLLFRTNSTLSGLQRSLTHSNWDHIAMVVSRPILSRNKSNLCLLESVNRGGIKCNPLEGALMEWRRKGLAKIEKHKRKLMSNHQSDSGAMGNEHPLMQDCSANSLAAAKASSSASGSGPGSSSSDRSPFPTISIRKLYNWAPSDELLLKLEAFVDSIVGNAYSLRGIFKLGRKMVKDMLVAGVGGSAAREKKEKKIKDTALQTAYFCSELIAACYRVAEILPMPPARGAAGASGADAASGHPPLSAGSSSPLFSASAAPSGSGSGPSASSIYAHGHGTANPFLSKPISDFLPGDFSTEEVDVRLALDDILWETAGVKLGEEVRIDLMAMEEPTHAHAGGGASGAASSSFAKQATSPASLSRENSTSAVHSTGDVLHIDPASEGGNDATLSVLHPHHAGDGDSPGALPPLPPSADSSAPSSAAPSPLARRARESRPGSVSGAGSSALGQAPVSDDEHNQSGMEDDSGMRSHSPSGSRSTQRAYSDATEPPLPSAGGSATRSAAGTPRLMESSSASRYSSGSLAGSSGARAATPTVPAAGVGSLTVPSVPPRRNSVPQPDYHSDRDVAIALGGRAVPVHQAHAAHSEALPPPILDSTPPAAVAATAAPPTATQLEAQMAKIKGQQKSKSKISQLMGSSFISTHTDWNPNPAAASAVAAAAAHQSHVSPPKSAGSATPTFAPSSASASSPSLSALPPPSLSSAATATATPAPRVNINKGSRDKIKALMGESVVAPRGMHIPPPSPSQTQPDSANQQRRAKTTSGADSSHSIAAAAAVASARHEPISPHASSLAVSIPLAGAPRPRIKQVKGSGDKLRELLGSSPAAVNATKGAGYSRRISLSADAGDVFTAHKLAPLPPSAIMAGAPPSAPALPELDSPHSDDAAEFVAVGAAPSASLAFLPAAWTSPAAPPAAAPVASVAPLAAPLPATSSAPMNVPSRPPRPPSMSVSAALPPAPGVVSAWAVKPADSSSPFASDSATPPPPPPPRISDPPSPPPPPPPNASSFSPPSSSLLLDPRRDSTDSIPPSPPPPPPALLDSAEPHEALLQLTHDPRDRSSSSTLSATLDATTMPTAAAAVVSPSLLPSSASAQEAEEAPLEITDLEDA